MINGILACRSLIPSICPKTSKAHSSKLRYLIDLTKLLSICLYCDRTADAAFVNFSRLVTLFPQNKQFVLKLNDGCEHGVFRLSALVDLFFSATSAIYHTWV